MNKSFLIIGQGKIGSQVSRQLAKQGFTSTGMARGERQSYDLDIDIDTKDDYLQSEIQRKVNFMQGDARQLTSEQLNPFSHIAIIVSPSTAPRNQGVEGYRNTYLAIAKHIANLHKHDKLVNLERLIFISSTGVYGQNDGEWIDESTIINVPSRESSNIILQSEKALQKSFLEKCIIIRPSGIYGTDRLMRVRKAKESDKPPMAEFSWTNRIMDSDLVTIIVNCLIIDKPKPVYLATDYQPVTSLELTKWLCKQLLTTAPEVDNQPQYSYGKRIHSNIPLDWLNYPDWKSGYDMILQTLDQAENF